MRGVVWQTGSLIKPALVEKPSSHQVGAHRVDEILGLADPLSHQGGLEFF